MKTGVYSVLISLLWMMACASCGSSREFSALDDYDNIDVFHIPQGVGWMLGPIASMGDKDAGKILKGFKSMTIVDCEGNRGRKEVMSCVKDAIDSDRSELILEVHEGKEATFIYGRVDEKSNKLKDIMIVADEPGDLSVIRAKGTFDISSLLNEQTKRLP